MFLIKDVVFPEDSEALHELIVEYAQWLAIDLSYQDFDGEMAALDSIFNLPQGVYTFAIKDGKVAGGVGFKSMDKNTAEVKRLYVRPEYQGFNLGRQLMNNLLDKLRCLGYERVVLDAVPPTQHAQALYERMGFYEIPAYFNNPTPNTKFFEYRL